MSKMFSFGPTKDKKAEQAMEKQKQEEKLRLAENESEVKKRLALKNYGGRSLLIKSNQSRSPSNKSSTYGGGV